MPLPGTRSRRRLYLMRHADVAYFDPHGRPVRPDDVRLTPTGVAQAEAVRDALAGIPFDRAVTSGLPRTRQTAEIVLAGRSLAIDDVPALREIRGGRLDAVAPSARAQMLVRGFDAAAAPDGRFAGGERFDAFRARVEAALETLLLASAWTHLLLVAHDGVNRAALIWATQAPNAAFAVFEQDMAALNLIDFDVETADEGPRITRRLLKATNLTLYDTVKQSLMRTSLEQVFGHYATHGPTSPRDPESTA